MTIRMQQRRDSAANWSGSSVILASGEIGVETDTGKIKVGNGSSLWSALPYNPISETKTSGTWAADTTTVITAGKICFNSDNAFFKIGNGTSTWPNLKYFKPSSDVSEDNPLNSLSDVTITSVAVNNLLAYDTTGTSAWKNKTIDSLGIVNTASTVNQVTNAMLAGSIANAKLTNSKITIGTTNVNLGDPAITTLPGVTSIQGTSGNVTVGNATGTSTVLGAPVNINSTGSTNTVISGGSGTATISGGTGNTAIGNTTGTTDLVGTPVGINTTAGNVSIGNASGTVSVPVLRVTSTTDATSTSTTHAVQVGTEGGLRLVLDSDEIHAYNGSAVGNLKINEDGGTVTIANASAAATTTINGPLITATGKATYAPITFGSSTPALLTTAVAGAVEYDGSFFYATKETTSGRGTIPVSQIFRLASNITSLLTGISDFYGATSSINLAASSVYEIDFFAYLTKSTAGTLTWTLTSSSAPTLITANYNGSPVTGNAAGTPITGYTGSANSTTAVFPVTGSLTTGVNHVYRFNVIVVTNAATTFKLQLTQSAGTATPLGGSYYKVNRISSTQGSFA
jgi:hypothetical protein